MTYFPEGMPTPEPTMDDAGFWSACRERRLVFQACARCGVLRHPPGPLCPRCRSAEIAWRESRGAGEIYTYTVVRHASHPAVRTRLPYVVAVIEFGDAPGVRLVSNITDVEPGAVSIGMPVELWWDPVGDGYLPRFRPARGES